MPATFHYYLHAAPATPACTAAYTAYLYEGPGSAHQLPNERHGHLTRGYKTDEYSAWAHHSAIGNYYSLSKIEENVGPARFRDTAGVALAHVRVPKADQKPPVSGILLAL